MANDLKSGVLIPTKAPALPLPPVSYDQRYVDQLLSILRLYFNTLDNFTQPLSTTQGGGYLYFPNGAFHQDGATALTSSMTSGSTTAIQVTSTALFPTAGNLRIGSEFIAYTGKTSTTFTGITRGVYGTTGASHAVGVAVTEALGVASSSTAKTIPFTVTDYSNGVALNAVDTSHIDFSVGGRYNIQFSAQLLNETASEDLVTFWFRLDGSDVANTAGVVQVPKQTGAGSGAVIASWNIVLDIVAGSYIELLFSSVTGNTVVATYPAGTSPVTPVSPSVILTATFVSAIPN